MLAILSPSKTQEFPETPAPKPFTQPEFLDESLQLVDVLRSMSATKISTLMDVSDKLGQLNHDRYQRFSAPFTAKNAYPCLRAFKGDVYDGIAVDEYSEEDFAFAQKHLRILSGLYGLLRPLDLIQPYRLEMKTRLKNPRGRDLYQFWGGRLTQAVNTAAKQSGNVLVNLASEEYFKAVQPKELTCSMITPVFQDFSRGDYRVVGLFAKRARGMMANMIIREKLEKPDDLKVFSCEGYRFSKADSTDTQWVFKRKKSV